MQPCRMFVLPLGKGDYAGRVKAPGYNVWTNQAVLEQHAGKPAKA